MRGRTYLRLGRVSNLPTVWTNVVAAVLLAGGDLRPGTLLALLLAFSLVYVGGMYLNDAFDRHVDARERPERPIPAGMVGAAEVFVLGYGMLATAVSLLALIGGRSGDHGSATILWGLALAAVVVYYDVRHKRDPLSPVVMGLCRVLVYLTAAVAAVGRLPADVVAGALVLLSYLIGLTYVAKQETLSEYRNVWPLAFLFAPFLYAGPALGRSLVGIVLYVAFLAWVARSISFLVRRNRTDIPRAVIGFIAGISLLDGLLIARAGHPAAAWLGVAGFGLTLFLQRYVRGT